MANSPLAIPLGVLLTIALFILTSQHYSRSWSWIQIRNPLLAADSDNHVPIKLDIADVKVPVVLGVMSRCPDALLCEAVFDDVLKEVGDKVNMSLSFIAKFVINYLFEKKKGLSRFLTKSPIPVLILPFTAS